jgi:hypothetical protein
VAALLAEAELFDPVRAAVEAELGAVDYASPPMPFAFTDYYEAEMGPRLSRAFFSIAALADPAALGAIKLATNDIERRLAVAGRRRANLDPGLLSRSRFILASTKDSSHRIPLGRGIYAEITLVYERGRFRPVEWTYPDYASPAYGEILEGIRASYVAELHRAAGGSAP